MGWQTRMPEAVVPAKEALLAQVLEAADALQVLTEPVMIWVPGRIEVLGKHTDYAGGRSLLAATTRGLMLAAYPRNDDQVHVIDVQGNRRLESRLHPDVSPRVGQWSNYPETVFRRMARNFPGLKGADVVFASDLPQAAGMSSSSAMIVGFFLALARVNNLEATQIYRENIGRIEDLGGYLGTIENGQTFGALQGDKGVGTFGGSEDHTAILCCRSGQLSQYAYCPVRFEATVGVPEGFTFVVGSSGVVAEKTGAAMDKYNRASGLAFEALRVWNEATGATDAHLAGAVLRAGKEAVRSVLEKTSKAAFDPAALVARFDHFYAENEEILPGARAALAAGDLKGFGDWVAQSQHLGAQLLQNQVPETVFLAASAREHGAVASSAFGAGFGGSVWTLVPEEDAGAMIEGWAAAYHKAFPSSTAHSLFFATPAGPAAFELGGMV